MSEKRVGMKNILVIVDAQNDFVDGALGSKEAVACIPGICKMVSQFTDGLIITTQDTHAQDYLQTKEGAALPVEHCIEGTAGWQVNAEIVAAIEAKISADSSVKSCAVTKPTFGSVELTQAIFDYVDDEEFNITFVGFCTDICVVSNALLVKATFYEQANIFVAASCCAGTCPQNHNAALAVMQSCQIKVQ